MNSFEGVTITGTIGVGKTAVAEALSELLHHKGMRHALIDVDWLGQVYPSATTRTASISPSGT